MSFRYALNDTNSLENINFDLNEGDFCVLYGASGCGKTTLLRQFKKELIPKGTINGEVQFEEKNLAALSPKESAAKIGFVSQNPDNQIVSDSVFHELAFGLENLGIESDVIRRRTAEMASFFGIGNWFLKKTNELSGGQKQILNLASVILMQPKLLLLDEPTAQLDPISAKEFVSMVTRLNREFAITVVMAEHKLDEVLNVATKICVMENGKIKYNGRPREIANTLLLNGETSLLKGMPAVTRIFFETENNKNIPSPLSVKEGKEWLNSVLSKKESLKTEKPQESIQNKKEEKNAVFCKNILFRYESSSPLVLNELSLKINSGEIFCILGENGSGKTTLLNVIAGIEKPIMGNVIINGKNIKKYKKSDLYFENIAYLPQNPKAIFVSEKLSQDLNGCEKEAKELGIFNLLSKHPYDLSAGELQKAAFAKVISQKPKILLLDEPTKGLDAEAKEVLSKILLKLKNSGTAVIVSTHDIEFAASFSDRCALLFGGSVVAVDSPKNFFSQSFFYTTVANRIARDFCKDAVTNEDVVKLCQK